MDRTTIASGVGFRTEVRDADYSVQADDAQVIITSITASRTFTLPDPATVGPTHGVLVKDESGLLTGLVFVTVVVQGGGTIDGAVSTLLNLANGKATFYSSGKAWFTR